MSLHDKNITPNESEILQDLKPPFTQSKEEIWDNLFEDLEDSKTTETKIISIKWFKYAAAASVIFALGLGLFAKLYTKTIFAPTGELATVQLPDNSIVTLNAETQLSYRPYWWMFEREVNLEGEAFFEVEKGSKFTVISDLGSTSVLGTSFNISTRNSKYKVYCKTGKVWVKNNLQTAETILTPNQLASLENSKFETKEFKNDLITTWKSGEFTFTAEALPNVFEEIERQYNVEINQSAKTTEYNYTGYFTKKQSIDSTLELICESFGLTFTKQKGNSYKVSKRN